MADQNPTTIATVTAETPAFGQGEVMVRPMEAPKVSATKEMAAAAMEPPMMGAHSSDGITAVPAGEVWVMDIG